MCVILLRVSRLTAAILVQCSGYGNFSHFSAGRYVRKSNRFSHSIARSLYTPRPSSTTAQLAQPPGPWISDELLASKIASKSIVQSDILQPSWDEYAQNARILATRRPPVVSQRLCSFLLDACQVDIALRRPKPLGARLCSRSGTEAARFDCQGIERKPRIARIAHSPRIRCGYLRSTSHVT